MNVASDHGRLVDPVILFQSPGWQLPERQDCHAFFYDRQQKVCFTR
jgi:hypothetical protein